MFFDGFQFGHTPVGNYCIHCRLHIGVALVDAVERGVQLPARDDALESEVPQCLMGQHEFELLFGAHEICEDNHGGAERITCGVGCVEVTFLTSGGRAAVQIRVAGFQVRDVGINERIGLDAQLAQEVFDQ